MNTDSQPKIDWQGWLRRWDRQQQGYVPEREARFTAMFDAVEQLLPESFVALDLACGPGSISQRLLARFPSARAAAVDMDPMMLALGQGALGTLEGRLRWIEADLAAADWLEGLGRGSSMWCSARPHCIGCGRTRWIGSTTTSLGCCGPAESSSTGTTWPAIQTCRPWSG